MPNWCTNQLTITASKKDQSIKQLNEFRSRLKAGITTFDDPNLNLLATFFPMPEKYVDTVDGYPRVSAEDGLTWYDWQVANWGVKWGDCEGEIVDDRSDRLILRFDTPWEAPTIGLVTISQQFDLLTFINAWDAEDGPHGYTKMRGGEVVAKGTFD